MQDPTLKNEKITGLNTLRFIAFFTVFIFHATPFLAYGGVDFFFVLSGFLLTFLAYQEIETKDFFSKWNFFMRRALRIFPLYYLIIAASFFIIPIIDASATLPKNKLLYWLFLSNYEASDCIFSLNFFGQLQ